MIEQEWMRFESTGKISDYLDYSRVHSGERSSTADPAKESSVRDGADHCAYRYGVGSNPYRGL